MLNSFKNRGGSLRRLLGQRGEDFFLKRINKDKLPLHVAVIMDGNGRWAKKKGLPRLAGHRAGVDTTREVVRAARQVGIKYLTLYTFSKENWRRPKEEIAGLFDLFEELIAKEVDELKKNGIRVEFIGSMDELPSSTQKACKEAMEETKASKEMVLNLAFNYGGRTEIVEAAKKIATHAMQGQFDIESLSIDNFADFLFTAGMPDPELLIRTSGEFRISNFLLWQAAYTEFWITPTLWPDFSKSDFFQAIYDFQNRKRRFGGVEEYA